MSPDKPTGPGPFDPTGNPFPPKDPPPQPATQPGTTVFGISKTTAVGALSGIIGTCGPLAAFMAAIPNHPQVAIAAASITAFATICRVWLGVVQGDAPVQK
jgi:hypothetical protein